MGKTEWFIDEEERAEVREGAGECELCGREENLVVDHNHLTGAFRGVLCTGCNSAIGRLGDGMDAALRLLGYMIRGTKNSAMPDMCRECRDEAGTLACYDPYLWVPERRLAYYECNQGHRWTCGWHPSDGWWWAAKPVEREDMGMAKMQTLDLTFNKCRSVDDFVPVLKKILDDAERGHRLKQSIHAS